MAEKENTLLNILKKIAAEEGYEPFKISITETINIITLFSTTYAATVLAANKNDLHLFIKKSKIGRKLQDSKSNKVFSVESMFYIKLLKIYREIEEHCCLKEEERLGVPDFYGCEQTENEEIIVLEDLVAKGYKTHSKSHIMDWKEAMFAVKELSKFHALSFALNERYPDVYKEYPCENRIELTSEVVTTYLDVAIRRALVSVKPEFKEILKKFTEEFVIKKYTEIYKPVIKPILCHLDYTINNVMFRTREDGKLEIKIVDLQTLQASSPVIDLLYFIFTGSDEQFRAEYFDKLVDYYYTQLCEAMRRLQLDPEEVYSKEDFDYELKEKLPFGLNIAIFTLPIITVEAENAPKVNKEMDFSSFSVENTSALYVERLNGVINDYVKWGVLK